MKRFTLLLIVVVIAVLFVCEPVYAGILSSTKDWILDNAIQSIIGLIFMIIAGFWGGTAWGKVTLKSKVPLNEATDIIKAVRNARRSDSPGGTKMTSEEKDAVFKEVEEFIASVISAFGGKT